MTSCIIKIKGRLVVAPSVCFDQLITANGVSFITSKWCVSMWDQWGEHDSYRAHLVLSAKRRMSIYKSKEDAGKPSGMLLMEYKFVTRVRPGQRWLKWINQ